VSVQVRRRLPSVVLLLLAAIPVTAPAAGARYLEPDQVRLEEYLPPPPAPGSEADQRDLEAVRAAQAARTPESSAAAEADAAVSVFRFADVLGPDFNGQRLPKTMALFRSTAVDMTRVGSRAKDIWQRPRPYRADPGITPLLGISNDGSYPSGHAMYGCMTAVLLGVMVPERRPALLARGEVFAANRVVGGVHYPTDVAAGCDAGRIVAAVLLVTPAFRADFAAAREETRRALGLPPGAPL